MKYLHVIYKAMKDECGIRSVDVARNLGVTKASVSRMMKLLTGMGLVSANEYGNINLTAEGEAAGRLIHKTVTGIYPFFAEHLELGQAEAIDSTYLFLSGFSERCVNNLMLKGWSAK